MTLEEEEKTLFVEKLAVVLDLVLGDIVMKFM